jgi:hypothetical protein
MRRTLMTMALALLLAGCDQGADPASNASLKTPIPSWQDEADDNAFNATEAGDEGGGGGSGGSSSAGPGPSGGGTAGRLSPTADHALVTVSGTFPAAFRARWTALNGDCRDTRAAMWLEITKRELHFYESVATLIHLERKARNTLLTEARYEGEGQTWMRRQTLTLSPEGDRLTIEADGTKTTRKRCP